MVEFTGVRAGRGKGVLASPTFQGGGAGVPPHTHIWAYMMDLKIPPGSLFFCPHNSTVLTPNQSVRRCFEKFIGVGTWAAGRTQTPPPIFPVGVLDPPCWKPFWTSFSVSSDIIICIISVYQSKNKPWSFPNAGSRVGRILHSLH